MQNPPIQNGYLVLVDLSGYTSFMAGSELDHAQAILTNILKLLRSRLTPTLQLAEVEGDALFLFAPGYRVPRGETLLELIESTYVAFRDARRMMGRAITCPCQACQATQTLDLKFVTHCGEYVLQDLTGAKKPFGSSVNLAHRLLKNPVAETTGWSAYALFTDAALRQMGVRPGDMHTDRVTYEHLGCCDFAAIDLQRRYEDLTAERTAYLPAERAHFHLERRFGVSAPRLWEYLNDPHLRGLWQMGSDWHSRQRPAGRTGPGAHNHCANSNLIEEVLDWRPFQYYTVAMRKGFVRFLCTSDLQQDGEGTALRWTMSLEGSAPAGLRASLCRFFATKFLRVPNAFDRLEQLLVDDASGQEARISSGP